MNIPPYGYCAPTEADIGKARHESGADIGKARSGMMRFSNVVLHQNGQSVLSRVFPWFAVVAAAAAAAADTTTAAAAAAGRLFYHANLNKWRFMGRIMVPLCVPSWAPSWAPF